MKDRTAVNSRWPLEGIGGANGRGEGYGSAVAVRVGRRTGGTNHDTHFRLSAALGRELNLHTYAHPEAHSVQPYFELERVAMREPQHVHLDPRRQHLRI